MWESHNIIIKLAIKEIDRLNVKRKHCLKESRRYKNSWNERFQSPFMPIKSFP